MANRILVPIDGSDHGWKALDLAVELARNRDAEIVVFHAMPYEPLPDGLKAFAKVEGISVQEEDALFHAARQIGDALTRTGEKRVREAGYEAVSSRSAEGRPSRAILDAAGLSFLGLGAQPPTPEWGTMLGSERNQVFSAPHLVFFPGLATALAAVGLALATVCPNCKGRPFATPPLWPPQQFRYTCPHCRHDLYLQ